MRLFDKCVDRGFIQRDIDSTSCVVLCIDPIAQYADIIDDKKHGLAYEDSPFCRPPWGFSFVEFNVMPGNLSGSRGAIRQAGALSAIQDDPSWLRAARECVEKNNIPVKAPVDLIVVHDIFAFVFGAVVAFQENLAWACDQDGTVLFYWWCPVNQDNRGGRMQVSESHRAVISRIAKTIALAFTFCNCSNVKLEDVTDDLQPPPKIRRRLRIPEVKRYTLNIAGHVSRPSRDYNEGPKGVMPFHLCRGHFATYTADKPMFGNPKLIGRYWHPPHMRGNKDNGEIIKDYAIKDSAEEAQAQADSR